MSFPRALVRPLLHAVHLVTFAVLFATGLLLFVPALRAAVTGGYSHVIRAAHWWAGIAFVVLPLAILARFGLQSLVPEKPPAGPRALWQRLHVALTLLLSTGFAVTGFVIWGRRSLPDLLVDPSVVLHEWLTWIAAALVAAHLAEVGVANVVERVRAAAGEQRGRAPE